MADEMDDAVIPRRVGTKAEVDAYVAMYERDRCECGGSPSWLDPRDQRHLASCTAVKTAPNLGGHR